MVDRVTLSAPFYPAESTAPGKDESGQRQENDGQSEKGTFLARYGIFPQVGSTLIRSPLSNEQIARTRRVGNVIIMDCVKISLCVLTGPLQGYLNGTRSPTGRIAARPSGKSSCRYALV